MALSIGPRARGRTAPASPAATRVQRSRWRDPRLVVGTAVVALSALLGARLLGSADDTVGVWVARHDVAPGRPLGADDVVRREVRFAGHGDADRYLSSTAPLPAGAVLGRAVGAGELVPRRAIGTASATSLTEVPLSVPSETVPSTVRTGSVVDVWVTPAEAGSGGPVARRAVLVFDGVPVVSAPRSGTALGPSATRQVIVGVGEARAAALPTALAEVTTGVVILTVRR